jgi:hypothetical protein
MDFLGGERIGPDGSGDLWGKNDTGSRIRFVPVTLGSAEGPDRGSHDLTNKDGVLRAETFEVQQYSREFTLVGILKGEPEQDNPFAGVTWELLLTSELAPPFSTCRLNFCFPNSKCEGGDENLLLQHADWVKDVWNDNRAGTRQILEKIEKEMAFVAAEREKVGRNHDDAGPSQPGR